jgi:hypothetical protein
LLAAAEAASAPNASIVMRKHVIISKLNVPASPNEAGLLFDM